MKTFIKIFIVFFSFFSFFGLAFGSGMTVKVTEKIPGANCTEGKKSDGTSIYECKIEHGFRSIAIMIGKIVKWFTAIATLAGVLFIVINGMMLSMGAFEKDKVKERIVKAISGLVLLLLSGIILNIIAPWIYK